MRSEQAKRPEGGWRAARRRRDAPECACCRKQAPFCYRCPCGFAICQPCMDENLWGMTCNNVYWTCPDCGSVRSF